MVLRVNPLDNNNLLVWPTIFYHAEVILDDPFDIASSGSVQGVFSMNFNSFFAGGGNIRTGSASGKFFGAGFAFGRFKITGCGDFIYSDEVNCNCDEN